ncbi:MmpS family transport accessory protein [Mycobacterium talmoniae]|uniref:Transport accessory protein MmpS3 n=1 Tax=Mycobacterium talmoniae TaxID=1858794 RepID=A0A1S1NI20_9MYCO|nr:MULTISPECIES: MmpS family transport accessory protein [Mycobacterium]OHV03469.1 hypothetical protein BKN37_14775 [Mycobacterium talmoniae]
MSDLKTYEYVDYPDDLDDDALYDDYREDDYDAPVDHRWRPVAVIAGGVFLAAVVGTAVILHGDNRGTQATVVGPPPTRTVVATSPPTPSAPPGDSLSPETVTTVTPSAAPSPSAEPAEPPAPAPVPQAAAPAPAPVNPRTVVYQVTGTKQLLDLVSVVYTDGQGLPHTDVNVSLPWTKSVVLEPGVGVESVTATSLFGQLNCSIVNATGQPIAVSANNSMIATCTR